MNPLRLLVYGISFILMKLRIINAERKDNWVYLSTERRRMLIEAERDNAKNI